ncbi:hypothetical protein [Limimaricola sp. AA108-03]|uniref:hypothetical protein n=1 Tax=Limimaricola sp. AA108-03 TaxID=3425945 RepID=UPI003D773C9A
MTGKDERGHSDPARKKDLDDGYEYPGRRTPPGHVPNSIMDDPGTGLTDAERRRPPEPEGDTAPLGTTKPR